ncbi:hypothetical protein [Streptomyces sp. NPDC059452]|uniref:hypothetical protein n=1 Tax=Streptomyces sp. NPDC059452 TaxID=3346835 RepID=UPI0036D1B53B
MTPTTTAAPATTPAPAPNQAPGAPPVMRLQEDGRAAVGSRISTRSIARQLPATLRRAWTLSWKADRKATLALALSAVACALLTALALRATSSLLAVLLAEGTPPSGWTRRCPS